MGDQDLTGTEEQALLSTFHVEESTPVRTTREEATRAWGAGDGAATRSDNGAQLASGWGLLWAHQWGGSAAPEPGELAHAGALGACQACPHRTRTGRGGPRPGRTGPVGEGWHCQGLARTPHARSAAGTGDAGHRGVPQGHPCGMEQQWETWRAGSSCPCPCAEGTGEGTSQPQTSQMTLRKGFWTYDVL